MRRVELRRAMRWAVVDRDGQIIDIFRTRDQARGTARVWTENEWQRYYVRKCEVRAA